MRAIDREKYDITPVYVTKDGEMYTGDALFTIEEYRNIPELLKKSKKVFFVRERENVFMKYENSKVGYSIYSAWNSMAFRIQKRLFDKGKKRNKAHTFGQRLL